MTACSVPLSGSLVRYAAASRAATAVAPHKRESRRGRIPEEPLALREGGTTDALFPGKVQFFLNFLIAGFSPDGSSIEGLLLDVPAEKPRHEVLGEGQRRGGAERHAPQGAKLVEVERPQAIDLTHPLSLLLRLKQTPPYALEKHGRCFRRILKRLFEIARFFCKFGLDFVRHGSNVVCMKESRRARRSICLKRPRRPNGRSGVAVVMSMLRRSGSWRREPIGRAT